MDRRRFQFKIRREIEERARSPFALWQGSVAERLLETMARLHDVLGERDSAHFERSLSRLEKKINKAARGLERAKRN